MYNESDIDNLSKHFKYEIEKLIRAKRLPIEDCDIDIKLEIFLTHARVLYDFFYKYPRKDEKNLKAIDFLNITPEQYEKELPSRNEIDDEKWTFRERCSSTLSHIWKNRDGQKFTTENMWIIDSNIRIAIERFIFKLKEEDFSDFKKDIIKLLNQ